MRCMGHPSCDDSSAARTRSRDSRTAVSGSPTTWYAGRPDETWTSTVTGCPSTPTSVALRTAASTATSSMRAREQPDDQASRNRCGRTEEVAEIVARGCDTHEAVAQQG